MKPVSVLEEKKKRLKRGKHRCLSLVSNNEYGLDFVLNSSLCNSGNIFDTAKETTSQFQWSLKNAGNLKSDRCCVCMHKRALNRTSLKHSGEWGRCYNSRVVVKFTFGHEGTTEFLMVHFSGGETCCIA